MTLSALTLLTVLLCAGVISVSPVAASSQLVMIGLHTKPTAAVDEMEALVDVHEAVEQYWNTSNILIMGDLNAECSYATQTELQSLPLRTDPRFSWLISDEVDTTTTSTDCAYDRFIASGEQLISSILQNSPDVFRYDLEYSLSETMTKDVSDHYPIELLIQSVSCVLRVSAFNIRTFGQAKVSKADVLNILVQIVKRYDIVLIQEIRDISETSIDILVDDVNTDIGISDLYKHTMSERLGRSSYKEQYSYVYRSDRVTLVDTYQYDDSADDAFEREPYCAKFLLHCGGTTTTPT